MTWKVIRYFPGSILEAADILVVDFWPTITCEGLYLGNDVLLRVGPGCVVVQVEVLEAKEKGFRRVVEKVLNRFRDVDDLKVEEPSKEHLKLRTRINHAMCSERVCPEEYVDLEMDDVSGMVFGEDILDWDSETDTFIVNLRRGLYTKVEVSPLGVKLYRDERGRVARIEVPEATKKGLLQAVYRYIVREIETEQ